MKNNKNLKSFLREEDGKAIKKSLMISSLGLILGFGITNGVEAGHSNVNNHSSGNGANYHSSTHSNHNNHSSY